MRHDQILPEGALIKVEFELRLPAAATAEEIEEWLNYEIGASGGISLDSPLINHDTNIWKPSDILLRWDGYIGRREEYGHEKRADGHTYLRVRYVREPAAVNLEKSK